MVSDAVDNMPPKRNRHEIALRWNTTEARQGSHQSTRASNTSRTRSESHLKDNHGFVNYQQMLATTTTQVLMPTDLHAGNILANGTEWVLIDPKPYVGDPAYDLTQHLLNCTDRLRADPLTLIHRMATLTDQDPVRVRSWLFARVACASWRKAEDVVLAETLRPTVL